MAAKISIASRYPRAIAIAAHPDDIEFYMAGTLLLLKQAGVEIHYMTLSSGNCGSVELPPGRTRMTRRKESIRASGLLGAKYHETICDDLEIVYDVALLRKVAATIRQVAPSIVLTHSPQDYMEDHINTSRLAVTAAFSRGMPNFRTIPNRKHISNDITVYHAMPHSLRGPLNELIIPEFFVETTNVHDRKRLALAAHISQKAWLDVSQGMDSYLRVMDDFSRTVGEMSVRFEHAEGWRRHNPLGFCAPEADPLRELLASHHHLNQYYRAPARD
ncbi:MAG TPA: PIG-L deacetylase family protein [Verrucomicrobiae bacterium]|nr:PIG-L deacetylase family protein [Verrucomicrobiae bacterium]